MTFRAVTAAAGGSDRTNTVELWDGPRQAATIHAQAGGVHIECAPGYEPDEHEITFERTPYGVIVGLRRS